jgi:hypothetical protein
MKKIAVVVAAITTLIGGGLLGYLYYDRQCLSPEVKRTLKAVMNPAASEADILSYMRAVRLQVRTHKDLAVVLRLESAFQLARDAQGENDEEQGEQIETAIALSNEVRSELGLPAEEFVFLGKRGQ